MTRNARGLGFCFDRLEESPGHRSSAHLIYSAYLRWCDAGNEPDRPLTKQTFYSEVLDRAQIEGWIGPWGRDDRQVIGVKLRRRVAQCKGNGFS
jgi:hypothetical protein